MGFVYHVCETCTKRINCVSAEQDVRWDKACARCKVLQVVQEGETPEDERTLFFCCENCMYDYILVNS